MDERINKSMGQLLQNNLEIERRRFNFFEPLQFSEINPAHKVFRETLSSRAFSRLKNIRFLGGIDYALQPSPNGRRGSSRYTRYQHSLGVAQLAIFAVDMAKLDQKTGTLAILAALLHDIGHSPLSHSIEPVFKEYFELDHHAASIAIIKGRVARLTDLSVVLRRNFIDIDELLEFMRDGAHVEELNLSNPINIDTIEGICRSHAFQKPAPIDINPVEVLRASMERNDQEDLSVVDDFWRYKDFYYKNLIQSPLGLRADYLCQQAMKENISAFSKHDFYITERTLFRKVPKLLDQLLDLGRSTSQFQFPDDQHFKKQVFWIDGSENFFDRHDTKRYRRKKMSVKLANQHPVTF